jgi:hypothetical protein
MWRPILERGDGDWLGTTGDARIWIGTQETEKSPVTFDNPVFLWPLLEKPFPEVSGKLLEHWAEFGLPESESPRRLIVSIVRSAVSAGRPYWVDLALNWLELMVNDFGYRQLNVEPILVEIGGTRHFPQATRHRALRIMRSTKGPA